jgi:protein SCO1
MFSHLNPREVKLRVLSTCVVILVLWRSVPASAQSDQKKAAERANKVIATATYRGGLVNPALPKAKFTLIDTSGAPYDFWQKTEGFVTLLFFGYTHCPDLCPLHMANIAMALKRMPSRVTEQIKVVFVTTDPGRDSPQALRAWLDRFDKHFIGLIGSEAAIEAAQQASAIPPAKKANLNNRDYQVAHASFVLAYTKDDLAHVIYPGGINQNDWAQDLPRLVVETWPSH